MGLVTRKTGSRGTGAVTAVFRVQFGDEARKEGGSRAGDAREMTNGIVVLVEGCKEEISGQ